MNFNVLGYRTRTPWKMLLATVFYVFWLMVIASLVWSVVTYGGPIGGLAWVVGLSIAGYILAANPNGLRDRLPVTGTWLKVLVWGLVSFVATTVVAFMIPETPEYQAHSAREQALREEKRQVAALKKAEEQQKIAQAREEEKRIAVEKKAEAERAAADKQAAEKREADARAAEQQPVTKREEGLKGAQPVASATAPVKAEEPAPPPSFSDQVRATVIKTLGQNTNMKMPRIREVGAAPYLEASGTIVGYTAGIGLNGDEGFTTVSTRGGLLLDSAKLLEALYKDPELKNVTIEWQLPLTDVYGRTSDGRVMLFSMDAGTAAKIQWTRFRPDNLPIVSQGYWEHPALTKK